MNKERTRQAAMVMLAFAEGKTIECRNTANQWHAIDPNKTAPLWNWQAHEYRVRPQVSLSRRFLWQTPGGHTHTSVITPDLLGNTTPERFRENLDSVPGQKFVRWIDSDWVAAEI